MSFTPTTHSPSALRLNSSEGSQGSNLLDDITSSLQDPVFMPVDGAKKMPGVEILSSSTEAEYFTIDEREGPGISGRDSRMSENFITKTDVGVAHSSIGTRNESDTKISLGTYDSDSRMSENFITKTDVGVAPSSIGTRNEFDTKISLGTSDSDSRMSENFIRKTNVGVAHSSIRTRNESDTKISLGTSDSDNRMSENFITKTNVGVAHASIGTRNESDTKISLGTSDSDNRMSENFITKTNVGVAHASIGTRNESDTKISLGTSDSDSRMSENFIRKTNVGVAHSSIGTRNEFDTKISLGTSDSDSRMSENFIRKTNVGVAHASIGTRNESDTKISHDILTQKSDTELAFFNTKSTDVDITPVYDDVLNTQPKVTPANMNEIYDDILNNQPKVTPAIMNEVYDDVLNTQPTVTPDDMNKVYEDILSIQPTVPPDNMNKVYEDILSIQPTVPPDNTNEVYEDVLNIKDEKIHDDSNWTKIGSEPLYASIRSVQNKEPVYTALDSLNTAPEETYSYVTEDDYEDIKRMKASREIKVDKNEGFPNRKEESFGDNETVNDTEYEYIITHKTIKNEKELSRNDLTLTPGNNEQKETIQIKNLEILLSEEKEKSAIQTAKCETLQNMYEATQQQKSVRTSETQTVDMNDKNQNNFELLEEIESPTKGSDLKEEEETVVTTDSWKENQCQDSETRADFVTDDKINDLLAKNECLHFQIEQLSFQLSKVYNRFMRKDSDGSIDSGQDSQLSPIQQQNDLLTLELEQLKQDYLHLQKEHQDLVHAGDILQEDYEKLLEERDKMQEIFEKVTNTKWVTQNEIAALETKNVIQEIPETINPNFENWEQGKQNIINKHSDTDLRTSQQKKPELLEDVTGEDGLRRSIQLNSCSEVLQDQSIILDHLQTLRDENKKLFLEKEIVIEDLEISFNENSKLKQKLNTATEDYSLLEKNYTSLLLEKQNVATKDISGLDSNNINDSSIQLHSNQQEQLQSYPYQPNERSIQTKDDNNIQQTLPNNSSEKEQIHTQKANQTELLKVLISQLQQQLIDSEKRYQETVQTYRLHLISAIQGHIDPDVKNGLFSIIEMRSLEEHC
eukprot:XP_014790228.1 PREDICTED: dentin sialophosphoprotein-like isoform X2 [Octopus bimaculoides]